jgi:extradiol dioxygenase family protein
MERFDEFDHCVIDVFDLQEAEQWYSTIFGEILGDTRVTERSMMSTDEVIHSKQQAGRRARIPGHEASLSASHGGVLIGEALLPLFVHQDHAPVPPPEELRGTPRLGFPATAAQLEKALEVLQRYRVPFEGPVEFPAPCPAERSLFFKDPSGNFIELSVPRDIGAPRAKPSPFSSYSEDHGRANGQRLTE